MTNREVVKLVLDHKKPPYVPWSLSFTLEAHEKLVAHYGTEDIDDILKGHFVCPGGAGKGMEDVGNDCVKDEFGVIWDRSIDKDIGNVSNCLLPEPNLDLYEFPDPMSWDHFAYEDEKIAKYGDKLRAYSFGFSVYERAWTLRGMENLMMDFIENPDFVHALLNAIGDYNCKLIDDALTHDIDMVHFGDDWGSQLGLQMGPQVWHEFIAPILKRMYGIVRDHGKYVSIHSCGKVDELFDSLVDMGLQCFNPFQPEVMDVPALMKKYRGKLSFHGGMSTQKTLPYGSVDDVVAECKMLMELGSEGNYIFAPAHAVEGDVPLENLLAMIDTVTSQPAYKEHTNG